MNSILEKIKFYYNSIYGRLGFIILILSFIITLILAIFFKNNIVESIFKGLMSSFVTGLILYIAASILKKYLGNLIENEPLVKADNSSKSNDGSEGEENTEESIDELESSIETENNSDDNNGESLDVGEDDLTVDDSSTAKKETPKTNVLRGDIGDIVLNSPFYNNNQNAGSVGSSSKSSSTLDDTSLYYNSDRKIKEREIEREALEDPDKTAKALRTMIAKDEIPKKE